MDGLAIEQPRMKVREYWDVDGRNMTLFTNLVRESKIEEILASKIAFKQAPDRYIWKSTKMANLARHWLRR